MSKVSREMTDGVHLQARQDSLEDTTGMEDCIRNPRAGLDKKDVGRRLLKTLFHLPQWVFILEALRQELPDLLLELLVG